MRKTWIGAVTVLVLVAVAWWLLFPRGAADPPPVRIGYLNLAASLPVLIAQEDRLFEQAGLTAELIEFKSSNDLAVAGATGRVDVMVTCATNAALDAMSTTQQRFQLFLTNGYTPPDQDGRSTDYLLARPGLTLDDLRGRTIAFFPGSVSQVAARIVLGKHGLPEGQYHYLELPPPSWLPSLRAGQIDAVLGIEPFATQIIQDGSGVPLIRGFLHELSPRPPLSGSWLSGSVLDARARQAVVTVFRQAVASIAEDESRARGVLARRTGIAPDLADQITLNEWKFVDDPGTRESVEAFVRVLADNQAVKAAPPIGEWLWTGK